MLQANRAAPAVLALLPWLAASPAAAAGPFDGSFVGEDGRLDLRQSGARVTGAFVVEGMRLPVTGTVAGNVLEGQVTMPTGESEPFTAQPGAGGLVLRLVGDPEPAVFRRAGAAPPADAPTWRASSLALIGGRRAPSWRRPAVRMRVTTTPRRACPPRPVVVPTTSST